MAHKTKAAELIEELEGINVLKLNPQQLLGFKGRIERALRKSTRYITDQQQEDFDMYLSTITTRLDEEFDASYDQRMREAHSMYSMTS